MRRRTRTLVTLAAAAVGAGIDWNRQLISILGTPNAQPATVHPTRSFAMLQAAEYDAVVSITHAAPPYRSVVHAPGDAPRCSSRPGRT